jgi:hypothetical protein
MASNPVRDDFERGAASKLFIVEGGSKSLLKEAPRL